MSDNLRTRAREAAKEWHISAGTSPERDLRHRQRWGFAEGYVDGFLAHADQHPTREQVDSVVGGIVWEATNHPVPSAVLGADVRPMRDIITDAVMELLDGEER